MVTLTQNYAKSTRPSNGSLIRIGPTQPSRNRVRIHLSKGDFPRERDLQATLFGIRKRWEA